MNFNRISPEATLVSSPFEASFFFTIPDSFMETSGPIE